MLLLPLFLSFSSSYIGLPIDRVLALLLTHHRSTIDGVRDTRELTEEEKEKMAAAKRNKKD